MPLYEYDHLEEWAVARRHVASEITLLCDRHHRERTAGLLPKDDVRRANSNPINVQAGASKPYSFHFSGTEATVEIGENSFTSNNRGGPFNMVPLFIDGQAMIRFRVEDEHLLLSMRVFDECNLQVLEIEDNELVYSIIPWDIELVKTTLIIRVAQRNILLEIEFLPPDKIKINKGRFLLNGIEVLVRQEHIFVVNRSIFIKGTHIMNASAGLVLGNPSPDMSCMLRMPTIPRYSIDRNEALLFEKQSQSKT